MSLAAATASAQDQAPPAETPPSTPFGARGQLALDDLFGVTTVFAGISGLNVSGLFAYQTSSSTSTFNSIGVDGAPVGVTRSSSGTSFALTPSVDYFIADRISIGGLAVLGYQEQHMTNPNTDMIGSAVALVPRVGYVISLGDDLLLWPRIGGGYHVSRNVSTLDANQRALSETWELDGELGFLVRLGRHAYVNLGPTIAYRSTSIDDTSPGGLSTKGSAVVGGARGTLGLVF